MFKNSRFQFLQRSGYIKACHGFFHQLKTDIFWGNHYCADDSNFETDILSGKSSFRQLYRIIKNFRKFGVMWGRFNDSWFASQLVASWGVTAVQVTNPGRTATLRKTWKKRSALWNHQTVSKVWWHALTAMVPPSKPSTIRVAVPQEINVSRKKNPFPRAKKPLKLILMTLAVMETTAIQDQGSGIRDQD